MNLWLIIALGFTAAAINVVSLTNLMENNLSENQRIIKFSALWIVTSIGVSLTFRAV